MNRELLIRKVERIYRQFFEQNSEIMLNANTDYLFDNILSIPYCKNILTCLEEKYTIPDELIDERKEKGYLSYFEKMTTHGQEYYIAYCLKLYKNLREHNGKMSNPYYHEIPWVHSLEPKDANKVFKTDFVRPIVDYIINTVTNEAIILYCLDRYRTRLERFKTYHFTDDIHERDLQKDIALYLFDNDIEFHRELDLGNGKLDFLIEPKNEEEHFGTVLDCNDKPFIVEVKYFKNKLQEHDINNAIRQLSAYMRVQDSYGCLLAYIKDADRKLLKNNEIDGIEIIPIYVGDESASNQ